MGFRLWNAAYHALKPMLSHCEMPHITSFKAQKGIKNPLFVRSKIHKTLTINELNTYDSQPDFQPHFSPTPIIFRKERFLEALEF